MRRDCCHANLKKLDALQHKFYTALQHPAGCCSPTLLWWSFAGGLLPGFFMPPCRQRQFARSGTASTTAPVVILIANPTTALEPDATTNHARPPPTGQTDAIYTRSAAVGCPVLAGPWRQSGGNPHPSYRRLGFAVSPPDPDHHPVAAAVGWNWLLRYRRILGLFAFFYALLHFAIYLVFDQFFNPAAIARDVSSAPILPSAFWLLSY